MKVRRSYENGDNLLDLWVIGDLGETDGPLGDLPDLGVVGDFGETDGVVAELLDLGVVGDFGETDGSAAGLISAAAEFVVGTREEYDAAAVLIKEACEDGDVA